MTNAEIEGQLEEIFDCVLTYHGYTKYLRDYEMVVYQSVDPDPKYGLVPRHLRFVFRICPEVSVVSVVRPDVWSRSLDDSLVREHRVTMDSTGYVWGVNCQLLYPGATLVADSPRAAVWSKKIGIPFYEVRIVGNAQEIDVIFSELIVDEVEAGYSPYLIEKAGVSELYESNAKVPLPPAGT